MQQRLAVLQRGGRGEPSERRDLGVGLLVVLAFGVVGWFRREYKSPPPPIFEDSPKGSVPPKQKPTQSHNLDVTDHSFESPLDLLSGWSTP